MKIINNPWVIGLIFLVITFFIGQVFLTRSLYSATQYIRLWPSSLGGNDRLNIDNLITIKATAPYNEWSITMLSDVVPVEQKSVDSPSFQIQQLQITQGYNSNQKYFFDIGSQKRQLISAGKRTFWVTLSKIKKIPLEHVSLALEYEFSISELSIFEKIINLFK